MDNPYSGELPKINKIAEDVHIIFDKISELELQASNIQSQISQVPYQTDEDGYDVNEGQRNALYGQLYSVNSLIEEANEARNQLQLEAYALVSDYQSKIAIYEEKARKTAETKSSFDKLSGYRFGARTATASSQFAEQRKMHYDDQVSILRSLSEAAQNAANGIQTATTIQTISERGEFNDPNKIFSGNHLENDKDVNEQKNDLEDDNWNGKPGESIKNINDNIAASILKNLEMDGIPYHAGKPDFSNVSHALVNTKIPDVGIVAAADAMLAKKYGVSEDDIVSYRQENGLEWRDDGSGNNANLIPKNISRAFEEGREENREPTAMEALTAYMYAHNYGEKDAAIYMKDPEWKKLHKAAFPNYNQNYTKLVKEGVLPGQFSELIQYRDYKDKPLVVDRNTFDNYVNETGLICFRTFSDSQEGISAKDFKNRLSSDSADNFQHNGTGLKAFGDGIYLTANSDAHSGEMPNEIDIINARDNSLMYGKRGKRATACVTVAPDIHIADGEELKKEFKKLPTAEQLKYMTNDWKNPISGLSGYAVALGYDGLKWKNAGVKCDYLTVYNRKKLIILNDPENTAFGIN